MSIARNLTVIFISIFLSYFLASFLIPYEIYEKFFPANDTGFFGFEFIGKVFAGFMIAYVFLLPFFLSIFGAGRKYIWIIIFTLPVLLLIYFLDSYGILFHAFTFCLGWGFGLSISRLFRKKH